MMAASEEGLSAHASSTRNRSLIQMKQRATDLVEIMCNQRDYARAATFIGADFVQKHGEDPPIVGGQAFIDSFKQMVAMAPDLHVEIFDAVAEVVLGEGDEIKGYKIWSYSRITGLPGGMVRDTVDMSEWDAAGKMVKSKDVQSVVVEAGGGQPRK